MLELRSISVCGGDRAANTPQHQSFTLCFQPLTYVQPMWMPGLTPAVLHGPRLSADCNPVNVFAVDVSQLQSPSRICQRGFCEELEVFLAAALSLYRQSLQHTASFDFTCIH